MISLNDFIYMPAAPSRLKEYPTLAPAPRRARLLIVDDERMITKQLAQVFTKLGYDVEAFIDPLVARRRFNADPSAFDLVLSDLSMPGLDGCALTRHVRERRPDLPVLIYTGFLTESAGHVLRSLGVRNILSKPTSLAELSSAVAEVFQTPAQA